LCPNIADTTPLLDSLEQRLLLYAVFFYMKFKSMHTYKESA